MDANTYYNSLISQGYSHEQAQQYTAQHYPGFGMAPAAPAYAPAAPVQPVVQMAPVQPVVQQQVYQPQSQLYVVPNRLGGSRNTWVAPWIGIGLIFVSLMLPFFEFSHDELSTSEEKEACGGFLAGMKGAAEGDDFTEIDFDEYHCPLNGFETMGYVGDVANAIDTDEDDSSSSSSDDDSDGDSKETFFLISFFMFMFSPFVFLLVALISSLMLAMRKHPVIMGALHLIYFALFLAFSAMGGLDIGVDELHVHSNFAGIGVYIGAMAGIALCIKA